MVKDQAKVNEAHCAGVFVDETEHAVGAGGGGGVFLGKFASKAMLQGGEPVEGRGGVAGVDVAADAQGAQAVEAGFGALPRV